MSENRRLFLTFDIGILGVGSSATSKWTKISWPELLEVTSSMEVRTWNKGVGSGKRHRTHSSTKSCAVGGRS